MCKFLRLCISSLFSNRRVEAFVIWFDRLFPRCSLPDIVVYKYTWYICSIRTNNHRYTFWKTVAWFFLTDQTAIPTAAVVINRIWVYVFCTRKFPNINFLDLRVNIPALSLKYNVFLSLEFYLSNKDHGVCFFITYFKLKYSLCFF